MAREYKKRTAEEKKQFAKQKQKEAQITLNDIYAIAAGYTTNPEHLIEYFQYSNNVYQYSPRNQILIQTQIPAASLVQSESRWKEKGYHIRPEFKGKGAVIIRPIMRTEYMDENGNWKPLKGSGKKIMEAYKKGELTTKEEFLYYERTTSAYDITMTDCPPQDYPKLFYWGEKRLSDAIMTEVLTKFAEKELSCPVSKESLIGAHGVYYPSENRIALDVRNEDTQEASTLAHEIGHAIQERSFTSNNIKTAKSETQKELEADCYSILICSRLGLEIPEGRKQHLSNFYNKYIQELIASGKYNPETDTTKNKNPFWQIATETKKIYEHYVDSLDALVLEQQGYMLYRQQFVDYARSLHLMSDTSTNTFWENQLLKQISKQTESNSFQEWFATAVAGTEKITKEEYIEQLHEEAIQNLSELPAVSPKNDNITAFVLQLQETQENESYSFRSYNKSRALSDNQYDFLFSYELPATKADTREERGTLLENVFSALNSEYRPDGFIGHSLSVSDVVVLYDQKNNRLYPYYCDMVGFEPLSEDFLSASMQEKLLNRFTVKEEIQAYQSLAEAGFDISSLNERASYLEQEYHPRILAEENRNNVHTVSVLPENIYISRFSHNDIPYIAFTDKENNIYLGNPERLSEDILPIYNNADGSLIHVGTGTQTLDLYRNDTVFSQSVLESEEYKEALNTYNAVLSEGNLSSLIETKPLFQDSETFENVLGSSENEQHEQNRKIATILDSIRYDFDSASYHETIGTSVTERQNYINALIQEMEEGELSYSSILETLQREKESLPPETASDIDLAIQYTQKALEQFGESALRKPRFEVTETSDAFDEPLAIYDNLHDRYYTIENHVQTFTEADRDKALLLAKELNNSVFDYNIRYIVSTTNVNGEVIAPDSLNHGSRMILNDVASALSNFNEMPHPRTFEMQILSDDISIPGIPFLVGRDNTIDIDHFYEEYKHVVGTKKEVPGLAEALDSLAETTQQVFPEQLHLVDARHEPRDFRLKEKIKELLDAGTIPKDSEKIILDHEDLILRRLSSIDKKDEFYTARENNNAVFENDDLYLTAIERTLNADKSLHPVACIQSAYDKLQWASWYEPALDKWETEIQNEDRVSYYVKITNWGEHNEEHIISNNIPTFRLALEQCIGKEESGCTYSIGMNVYDSSAEKTYEEDCFFIDEDIYSNTQYVLNLANLGSQSASSAVVKQEIQEIKEIISSGKYKQLEDVKISYPQKKPFVHVEWSEHPDFMKNEVLSLKDAQKKFAKLDVSAANDKEVGYYKTKFSLVLPNNEVVSDRYDLGDGYGGLIEFIDEKWSFRLDYNLEQGSITQEEYDKQAKEKNLFIKNLWNDIDMQYAETFLEQEHPDLAEERLQRIEGRNKWFKEHGEAGELNFQSVPKITEGKNPIKTAANKVFNRIFGDKNSPTQTSNPAQDVDFGQ